MFGTSKAELRAIVAVQDCTIRLKDVLLKSRAKQIESLKRSRDELAAKVAELTAEVERLRSAPVPSEPGIVVDGTRTPQRVFIDGHEIHNVVSVTNGNEPGAISRTTIVLHGTYSVRERVEAPAEPKEPHIRQPLPMWTGWDGGECPVPPDTRVDVRFRSGTEHYRMPAGGWRWMHRSNDGDIVAYRIAS